jgi:cell division protein FtsB
VSAKVAVMQRENSKLQRQHEALGRPGTVEAQARALGMMKHGERSYIISNLPNN